MSKTTAMTCYSKDLRERALKYLQNGHTYAETMEVYSVGKSALWRWKKMLEEQGNLDDKPRGAYFKKIDPKKLTAYIEEHPDAYLHEIAEIFSCSAAAVCKALKRLGYTNKKRNYIQRAGLPKSRRVQRQNKAHPF